jgi:HPt (histidine-containing phosphotransfer) domain-containing protein
MGKFRTETKNDGGGDYLVIHQPNTLRQKVGRLAVDPVALERAEAALRDLAASYPAELARNAKAAQAAWEAWRRTLADEALKTTLVMAIHDIKGQAGSFGFPLATEVARSLGIVLRNDAEKIARLAPAIDAHLGALIAIAVQMITDDGGRLGADLIAGLRMTLEKFGLDPDDTLTS